MAIAMAMAMAMAIAMAMAMAMAIAMAMAMAMAMARPFGARRAGPPLPGVERKYWKSSQEKVSRKTILYFLEKHSKRFETYLERQISSR